MATGGTTRVDGMDFDPRHKVVAVADDSEKPAFGTFVPSEGDHAVSGKLVVPGAADGVEQPSYVPEIGGFARLHRPVEHWLAMVEKVAPFARHWHVENCLRTEDEASGPVVTAPTSPEPGIMDDRTAIGIALGHGFGSPFLCEHRGGDGPGVGATNRDDLHTLLPRRARTTL